MSTHISIKLTPKCLETVFFCIDLAKRAQYRREYFFIIPQTSLSVSDFYSEWTIMTKNLSTFTFYVILSLFRYLHEKLFPLVLCSLSQIDANKNCFQLFWGKFDQNMCLHMYYAHVSYWSNKDKLLVAGLRDIHLRCRCNKHKVIVGFLYFVTPGWQRAEG